MQGKIIRGLDGPPSAVLWLVDGLTTPNLRENSGVMLRKSESKTCQIEKKIIIKAPQARFFLAPQAIFWAPEGSNSRFYCKNRARGRHGLAPAAPHLTPSTLVKRSCVGHDLEVAAPLRTPLSSNLGKMAISRIALANCASLLCCGKPRTPASKHIRVHSTVQTSHRCGVDHCSCLHAS